MDTNAHITKSISLEKYGIVNVSEIIYNPSYDYLYNEELNPALEGFERGQLSELGAVNVMTGEFTGRSLKTNTLLKMALQKIPFGGILIKQLTITNQSRKTLGML